uniref:Uncharacterized protein n=1 Tax=Rhinolophus ferrumequinum TaxID=59479 RepID=A0A671E0S4_RHIFE
MQALDGVTGAMVGGTGSLGSQGGPMGPGAWGSTRAEGSTAGGAPQSVLVCLNRNSTIAFTVPFLSCMDAEVACQYLIPLAEPYHRTVHWELTVAGSDLVRWIAENPDLLRVSINSFLEQLSVVVRNIQGLGPNPVTTRQCTGNRFLE